MKGVAGVLLVAVVLFVAVHPVAAAQCPENVGWPNIYSDWEKGYALIEKRKEIINCFDKKGETMLMAVARGGQDAGSYTNVAKFIEQVMKSGGDPRLKNAEGKTAADLARGRGFEKNYRQIQDAIELMYKSGAKTYTAALGLKDVVAAKDKSAAEKARADYEKKTVRFRKNLQPGDESTYGMVIEVKGKLAKVQTTQYIVNHYTEWKTKYGEYGSYKDPELATQTNAVPVEKWFRITDLYPSE